jgi:hypothetical protein
MQFLLFYGATSKEHSFGNKARQSKMYLPGEPIFAFITLAQLITKLF